ncbi:hypothetical protein MNBD_GAMMA10-2479 [hydrothermal vent metagenome]|uniref:Lipoprotein n=1 Tax=hydrothermal vent metagenome TaxID=652676 RepID=A0A3B0XNE5_9ZZZZ
MFIRAGFIFLAATIILLQGCTAVQTFPNVAREGDTISLAVGSPRNMTRANTTAIFTDADGLSKNITANIRAIFRLYPDPASRVYMPGVSGITNLVDSSGHSPWITVVALDLPSEIASGPGEIQFTTSATYPAIGSHINDFPISIMIIEGVGSANSFNYEFGVNSPRTGDLKILESQPKAVFGPVYPDPSCPCPDYAVIEVRVAIPTASGVLSNKFIRVLAEDLTVKTESGRNVSYSVSGDGSELIVAFTSVEEKLKYYEAQFSVVLHELDSFTDVPIINSIRYFDINGDEVTGPVAGYSATIE